jgi:endonuclease/exonuclease/phosphatase family metal-dependent hydrolase
MRIMSWNVDQSANSSGRIDNQLEAIAQIDPDILLLQEARYYSAHQWLEDWRAGPQDIGLGEMVHSRYRDAEFHDSDIPPHSDIKHNNGHLTADSTEWSFERQ